MKEKMKKTLAIMLSVIMIMSMTACSKSEEAPEKAPEVTATATEAPEATAEPTLGPEDAASEITEAPESVIDEVQPLEVIIGTQYDSQFQDGELLATDQYQLVSLTEDYANRYPVLSRTLTDVSSEMIGSEEQNFSWICDCAKEELDMNGSFDYGNFYSSSRISIKRADSSILSFIETSSFYSGGIHDMYGATGRSFDTKTGAQLTITDVFQNSEKLEAMILEQLHGRYGDALLLEPEEPVHEAIQNGSLSWVVDYTGIIVMFQPYELASFADGILYVTIPFKGNEQYFNEDYIQIPKSYSYGLNCGNEMYADFNGDGEYDEFFIYPSYDEYQEISGFYYTLNGQNNELQMHGYDYNTYFLHVDGAKSDYLVLEMTQESDWRTISIFEIGENLALVYSYDFGVKGAEFSLDDSTTLYGKVLYTPSYIALSSYEDVLGTCGVDRSYYMNADGKLSSYSDLWNITSDFTLTLKKDLEAFKSESFDGETIIIPTGTDLRPLQANLPGTEKCDDSFTGVICITPDGTHVSFKIDKSDWPHKVNGISIDDLFDGIIYAG